MTKQLSLIVAILVIIGVSIFLLSGNRAPQAPTAPAASAPSPAEQPASQPAQPAPPTTSGPVVLQPPASAEAPAGKLTTPEPQTAATAPPTSTSQPAVKEFTVTAKQFAFDPPQITVKLNDRVRLKVTSIDVTHGLAIPQFNVSEILPPNETKTIEFTADKQGTFRFFCSVYCGDGHTDMNGSLIVQ